MKNKELSQHALFGLLISYLQEERQIDWRSGLETGRSDEEWTIEFRCGNTKYLIRYVFENSVIVLHYSLDDDLRMHFPMNHKGIKSLVGIVGIEIFVTT